MIDQAMTVSKEVLQALNKWSVPVNPFEIAADEEIELAPGNYGNGFDARLEYLPTAGRFVIFYQPAGPFRSSGRVHFSIGHELGHFYLPHHREKIIRGQCHNSQSDFRSKDSFETQADEFAANLLMPAELFETEVRRFRQQICTLSELKHLAENKFKTSLTSTARRYCECGIEACSVVISKDGRVLWAKHSEEMVERKLSYIAFGSSIARASRTHELLQRIQSSGGNAQPVQGKVDSDVWYDGRSRLKLWEEACALGNDGYALTYLTIEEDTSDFNDDECENDEE